MKQLAWSPPSYPAPSRDYSNRATSAPPCTQSRESAKGAADPAPAHALQVFSIAISADGSRAASASWDTSIRIWDLRSAQQGPSLVLMPPSGTGENRLAGQADPSGRLVAPNSLVGQRAAIEVKKALKVKIEQEPDPPPPETAEPQLPKEPEPAHAGAVDDLREPPRSGADEPPRSGADEPPRSGADEPPRSGADEPQSQRDAADGAGGGPVRSPQASRARRETPACRDPRHCRIVLMRHCRF
jgi:hypothetical protein